MGRPCGLARTMDPRSFFSFLRGLAGWLLLPGLCVEGERKHSVERCDQAPVTRMFVLVEGITGHVWPGGFRACE